jgi:hypothetical protein
VSIGLLEILSLIEARMRDKSEPFAYEVLYSRYPPKKVDRKFESICRKGYIEFGVSVRTGWLTGKGMAKLYELRAISGYQKRRLADGQVYYAANDFAAGVYFQTRPARQTTQG